MDTNFDPLPDYLILAPMDNNWAPPYAGPSHFDYRIPLARSRALGRWTPGVSMKDDFLVSF